MVCYYASRCVNAYRGGNERVGHVNPVGPLNGDDATRRRRAAESHIGSGSVPVCAVDLMLVPRTTVRKGTKVTAPPILGRIASAFKSRQLLQSGCDCTRPFRALPMATGVSHRESPLAPLRRSPQASMPVHSTFGRWQGTGVSK